MDDWHDRIPLDQYQLTHDEEKDLIACANRNVTMHRVVEQRPSDSAVRLDPAPAAAEVGTPVVLSPNSLHYSITAVDGSWVTLQRGTVGDREITEGSIAYVGPVDTAARDRVIAGVRGMVRSICFRFARRMRDRHAAAGEMMQEAYAGITRAWHLYEVERGLRFTTWAAFWIQQTCVRWLKRNRIIHVPDHLCLAERKQFDQILSIDYAHQGNGKKDMTLKECLSVDDDPLEKLAGSDVVEQVRQGIKCLPLPDKEIVELRMSGKTLEQIAQAKGLTRERIRQIEFRAHAKLRRWMGDSPVVRELTPPVDPRKGLKYLDGRERRVVERRIAGESYRDIAQREGISKTWAVKLEALAHDRIRRKEFPPVPPVLKEKKMSSDALVPTVINRSQLHRDAWRQVGPHGTHAQLREILGEQYSGPVAYQMKLQVYPAGKPEPKVDGRSKEGRALRQASAARSTNHVPVKSDDALQQLLAVKALANQVGGLDRLIHLTGALQQLTA